MKNTLIAFLLLTVLCAFLTSCNKGNTTVPATNSVPSTPIVSWTIPGDGQVTLGLLWNADSTTSYTVYYSPINPVTTSSATKVTGIAPFTGGTKATITGLANGTTYYFIVTAVNDYGESPASSQVSATPIDSTAPTGVQPAPGVNQVTLSWSVPPAPSGPVNSYTVYYATTDPVTISSATMVTGLTGTSTTITGLANGTTYYFVVTAVYESGESQATSQVGAIPNVVTSLATGQDHPYGIALDSASVYWTELTSNGSVKKVGIQGGTVTTLAAGQNAPHGIAVDSTSVYWTELAGYGSVNKVGINGGAVTTLASGLGTPYGIAVDSASVYWTETGAVRKVGINGGAVTTIAEGQGLSSVSLVVDATSVYWPLSGGSVQKAGVNGGTVTPLDSETVFLYGGIAIDSTSVYWADDSSGAIRKVGIDGGTVITLAAGLNSPRNLVVDSSRVYWTEDNGTVNQVPK